MRLGISSYTYTWAIGVPGFPPARPMNALDLLTKAAALGVSVVQIADNLPLDALTTAQLEELGQSASRLQITVEVGTRGIALDHLHRYLKLAQFLGSPILRVVVDTADSHPSADEVAARLQEFEPELAQSGVVLAIENHDRFTAECLADIIKRINSDRVGICLDTVNSLGALQGPCIVVDTLARWTVNLHVKDFTISRAGHMMGFLVEGRPAGQGRLDLPWLLRRIAEAGRDPNAILELWTPPADSQP